MALWEITRNGETWIEYAEGAYSMSPPVSGTWAKRFAYTVPYTNVGKGGFIERDGKKFHTPSYTEVHPETTHDDIIVEKNPFQELFVEPQSWEFESSDKKKKYTVKHNRNGDLSCSCWGYISWRKCKHIEEVKSKLEC